MTTVEIVRAARRRLVPLVADKPRRLALAPIFHAGAEAWLASQPLTTNPHPAESVEAAAWVLGWHDASREDR